MSGRRSHCKLHQLLQPELLQPKICNSVQLPAAKRHDKGASSLAAFISRTAAFISRTEEGSRM